MKAALVIAGATTVSAMTLDANVGVFQEWKLEHGKTYDSDAHEYERFEIFKKNAAFVLEHNMDESQTYTVALNQFADMSSEEYQEMLLGSGPAPQLLGAPAPYTATKDVSDLPADKDWRTEGYVNEVKNQGQCGSCWAFSTVASYEGQYFNKTNELKSFSEQQLVDCSGSFGNQGCNGGLMDQAFQYIKTLDTTLDTEDSYPYKGFDGQCTAKGETFNHTLTGYTDVASGDESALQQAVAEVGPISVAIDASHPGFQMYSSGVYHSFICSAKRLDHGVTAVGYGTESGKDYWWVRNSWGPTWGNKGYIKMSRNRNNNCGIATAASFPIF